MQQIHCIDDERAVTGILTDGITELLDWLDCVFEQNCAPTMQVRRREVAPAVPQGWGSFLFQKTVLSFDLWSRVCQSRHCQGMENSGLTGVASEKRI